MSQETINLFISVDAGDIDDEERDKLARQLLEDLKETEDISVELAKGDKLPKDAMGDPITIGTILVALGASAVTGIIAILASWLSRDERRSATLHLGDKKLELTGITKEEQTKVIEWFRSAADLDDVYIIGPE